MPTLFTFTSSLSLALNQLQSSYSPHLPSAFAIQIEFSHKESFALLIFRPPPYNSPVINSAAYYIYSKIQSNTHT